jgi:hypothetical protein
MPIDCICGPPMPNDSMPECALSVRPAMAPSKSPEASPATSAHAYSFARTDLSLLQRMMLRVEESRKSTNHSELLAACRLARRACLASSSASPDLYSVLYARRIGSMASAAEAPALQALDIDAVGCRELPLAITYGGTSRNTIVPPA